MVPVQDALLDGDRGEGRRVDVVGHAAEHVGGLGTMTPRAGAPAATIPTPTATDRDTDQPHPHERAEDSGAGVTADGEAGREPAEIVCRRSWFGNQSVQDRTTRADDDQAAEQGDLGPELLRLCRHQERADHRDEEAEHGPADSPGRHGLRVGDHEEHEDQHLWRGDDHSPVVEPADRRERPARRHAVSGRREQPDPGGQGDPERRRHGEQPQARRDQQPADEDDGVGRDHPAS